ncbi:PREDICTED: interferon beta [Odobenus rosmarus divergens]|uniref:Interferon beta n=1 Tax=Odobenus rosmarus divergens TaxID=9708 RepID=A0A2U3WBC3_ODORO|nr:PREDICTED: interferon beta [Odobenus rosmarus divergens]
MTSRCILQTALLVYFCTTVLAMNYDLLQFQLSSSSVECQELLLQLNGTSKGCLKDRMNFKIPEEIKKSQQFQKEDIIWITLEMFGKTSDIFRRNLSSTGWNETIVEDLLATLHRQKEHLEGIMEEGNFTWDHRTLLHLKRYYLRIVQYLKAKKYSTCAWTIVQAEILRGFFFLDKLTGYLLN